MTTQATYYIIRALVALVAIPFHEAGHALAAWLLGDATAKREGRLSLNPFAHFDLLGTLCMVFAGVGWAKPVSTNPRNFKNPKQGMALTALAGPVSNFVLALLLLLAAIPGDNAWNTVHNVLRGLMGWCCYLMGPLMMIVAVLLTMDRTAITPGLKSASVVLMVLLPRRAPLPRASRLCTAAAPSLPGAAHAPFCLVCTRCAGWAAPGPSSWISSCSLCSL